MKSQTPVGSSHYTSNDVKFHPHLTWLKKPPPFPPLFAINYAINAGMIKNDLLHINVSHNPPCDDRGDWGLIWE